MSNYETLYHAYLGLRRSLAKAVSTIVPPREIEDIVQETYVRICEVSEHEAIQYPRSFLFRVARNLALDHIKRAESRLTVSMDDDQESDLFMDEQLSDEDETFNQVAAKEEFALLCEAVRELPLQCRRAFVLKKVYGYSQKEIALDLNISESTVEKHIATGIKRCTHFMTFHTRDAQLTTSKRVIATQGKAYE
jgi:RNA polymerase sigma factor (sigma-70 family)